VDGLSVLLVFPRVAEERAVHFGLASVGGGGAHELRLQLVGQRVPGRDQLLGGAVLLEEGGRCWLVLVGGDAQHQEGVRTGAVICEDL